MPGVDLTGAQRYLRFNFLPHLSACDPCLRRARPALLRPARCRRAAGSTIIQEDQAYINETVSPDRDPVVHTWRYQINDAA
jgi:hypothetical protein